MVIYHGTYRTELGKRSEFIAELKKNNLEERFRNQPGNIFYTISASITDEDVLVLCDAWESREAFDGHVASADCDTWFALQKKYAPAYTPHQYEFEHTEVE